MASVRLGRCPEDPGMTWCAYCDRVPITRILSPAGSFCLCWEHTKLFTGWTTEEFEAHHARYAAHVKLGFKRGAEADALAPTTRRTAAGVTRSASAVSSWWRYELEFPTYEIRQFPHWRVGQGQGIRRAPFRYPSGERDADPRLRVYAR